MSDNRPIDTVRTQNGWGNRREGSGRVAKVYPTKAKAQAAGRRTAQKSRTEHVIDNMDGKIGEKNSYGNDPHPPKG